MPKMKKTLLGLIMAIGMGLPQAGQAMPVETILWLAIDESGSIGQTDFDAQMDGYVSALNAIIPTDGTVAIGAATFDSNINAPTFSLIQISSAADLTLLTDWATGWKALYDGGNTDIAEAIDFGVSSILTYMSEINMDCADLTCIIDVSTDGSQTTAGNPTTSAAAAVAANIQVNCIGIGGSANCDFATNNGGLDFTAANFNNFEAALRIKLATETGQSVPEPGALLIVALGLLSLSLYGRRRKV